MYLNLTRITHEAHFDCERADWYNGKATTEDVFHSLETETVLVNCDHVAAIKPHEYKYDMSIETPAHDASSQYLLRAIGACVVFNNGRWYNVTETVAQIDAAIGTQYVVEKV